MMVWCSEGCVLESEKTIKQISLVNEPTVTIGYQFSVEFERRSHFLKHLAGLYTYDSFADFSGDFNRLLISPEPGDILIGNIKCFVEKLTNGNLKLWFESEASYRAITKRINDALAVVPKQAIYKFDRGSGGWYVVNQYDFKRQEDLIGYDKYFEMFAKDVLNSKQQWKFLQSIGETKSLNYLLYGPPGTGKTTMIRALASKYNYPVYIVNSGSLNLDYLDDILSPQSSSQTIIILFEDFDRFLSNGDSSRVMSQILNSMDGLQDSKNVIRFFTGNDCEVIFRNKALVNRMSAKLEFFLPTEDMFKIKIKKMLVNSLDKNNETLLDNYASLIANLNISMRPFISYSIRYLFDENPLETMIANIAELNTS